MTTEATTPAPDATPASSGRGNEGYFVAGVIILIIAIVGANGASILATLNSGDRIVEAITGDGPNSLKTEIKGLRDNPGGGTTVPAVVTRIDSATPANNEPSANSAPSATSGRQTPEAMANAITQQKQALVNARNKSLAEIDQRLSEADQSAIAFVLSIKAERDRLLAARNQISPEPLPTQITHVTVTAQSKEQKPAPLNQQDTGRQTAAPKTRTLPRNPHGGQTHDLQGSAPQS